LRHRNFFYLFCPPQIINIQADPPWAEKPMLRFFRLQSETSPKDGNFWRADFPFRFRNGKLDLPISRGKRRHSSPLQAAGNSGGFC